MNQVPPGGRGGPGPGNFHEVTKDGGEKARAPLETNEFNLTPFVNQSPAEKRLRFETARGRQLGMGKGPLRPRIQQIQNVAQVMGPGTASGVHSGRVALGRRHQMEKVQLQLIIDKLAKFTKQTHGGSARAASSRPVRGGFGRSSMQKKSNSVLAAQAGAGKDAGLAGASGGLGPPEEAEKTEEQKEMERFLQPIMYTVAEGLDWIGLGAGEPGQAGRQVEIRNPEDLAPLLKLPELNGKVIRELAAARREALGAGNGRDEQFDKLTLLLKPQVDYYKMGLGDRQLYLRRVERLTYDIMEEEELRKQREQELGLEQARQQRGAGQQSVNTESRAVGGRGRSPGSIK